jgi:required for meiotic nuclear division protein 1
MKTINFICYKLASRFPLGVAADFFHTHRAFSWKEYIVLGCEQLESVLKYSCSGKYVYLFSFGCLTFINFEQDEVYTLLRYIESITGKMDYSLISTYNESHRLEIDENNMCRPWRTCRESVPYADSILQMIAVILAKSTELYKVETDISKLLDSAEMYINYLQRGRLPGRGRVLSNMTLKIIRFQYETLESIKIYDRPNFQDDRLADRAVYDGLSNYYELKERVAAVQNKTADLQKILEAYSSLSHNRGAARLVWLEVFLLALFPVFHIIHLYMDKLHPIEVLRLFLR